MSEGASPKEFLRLLYRLREKEAARSAAYPETSRLTADRHPEELAALRRWQSDRLRKTYADFLTDPNYRSACEFFLDELYAPKDFSQRDRDTERLYDILSRYLPETALSLLLGAITLNQLTNQLDQDLLDALIEIQAQFDPIPVDEYAEAYRKCDNYQDRTYQIELLVSLLRQAAAGARSRITQFSLKLAKTPAYRLGWQDLYRFLEDGVSACKPMPDVDRFVGSIRDRELSILERIYANDPHPFA